STDIVKVSNDAKSVNSIGEWPFKRSQFADAIDIIIKDSPAVVGINLSITDNKELETDQKLYDVLRSFDYLTIIAPLEINQLNKPVNKETSVFISYVESIFPLINHSHSYIKRAENGTVTSIRPYIKYKNNTYMAFSLEVIKLYYSSIKRRMSDKLLKLVENLDALDNDYPEILIDYRRSPDKFEHYSFIDLINNKISPLTFKNKIVLVGLTDKSLTTKYITPFTGKNALTSTSIELNAQIVDSFLNYRGLTEFSNLFLYLFSILLGLLTFYLYKKNTVIFQGIIFVICIVSISVLDFVLFKYFALWLPPALPLALLFCLFCLSLYFTITNVDKEIINTINIFHSKQKLPLAKVPSDITSRVGALKDLLSIIANDRNTINAIIDGINNGIIVFDSTGKVIWANARILELYNDSLVLDNSIESIIEDIKIASVVDEIENNSIFKTEIMLKGYEFLCIISVVKAEKPHYVAIFNDITELKQSGRLKTDMVRMVSHELKNPLAAIQLCAENILFIEDRSVVIENADSIVETAELLRDTINDFLSLSKLEGNISKIMPVSGDLRDVINKSITLQKPVADKKNLNIIFDNKEIPDVLIDKEQIFIVINNLLANAIKYSPDNNEIIIDVKNNIDHVLVSVIDYGIGIPEDEQNKVFDKFYRSRNNKKDNIEGTGLGLSIVSSIIHKHNSEISLKSEYGKGSIFSFTLPVDL
ncbi:MAG: ATP-binding protein, partial [Vampirovibrionia bacterium]